MSIQTRETITASNPTILALAGELFQNTNIKVSKTASSVVTVDGKKIIKQGTIVAKDGTKAVTASGASNAFGIVYREVDLTNSHGNETIPVLIFGFVKSSVLPTQPTTEEKAALKMITFL